MKRRRKYRMAIVSPLVLKDMLVIATGVYIAGFALKGFLVPNKFLDGGITGISLLLHKLYDVNLGLLIFVCNLPFIVISYFTISRSFAVKSLLCVVLFSSCLLWVPYPVITSDKLLISLFGGFFLGLGMGLAMRNGYALDGIEILVLHTLKRTGFTAMEIIMAINTVLFSIAALKFGLESSLYSILTYFAASTTMNYIAEGVQEYMGVSIISAQNEQLKEKLVHVIGRAITVYKGERGFLPGLKHDTQHCDILFTVITRLELRKLKNAVYETDPNAFVFAHSIKDASGGMIKGRNVHP